MNRAAAVGFVGCLAMAAPATAQDQAVRSPVHTSDHRIAESLLRIERGSALWRRELDALRGNGRRAIVLPSDRVVVVDPSAPASPQAFDPTVLAEVSPVVGAAAVVETVLVVVNLPLLDQIHDKRNSLPAERDADLDRILVHEVYGHAFPYLRAGNMSGRCADPESRERASDACSIVRENAVRSELGLGRRTDYGLGGLLLASDAAPSPRGPLLRVAR